MLSILLLSLRSRLDSETPTLFLNPATEIELNCRLRLERREKEAAAGSASSITNSKLRPLSLPPPSFLQRVPVFVVIITINLSWATSSKVDNFSLGLLSLQPLHPHPPPPFISSLADLSLPKIPFLPPHSTGKQENATDPRSDVHRQSTLE